jgi:threonine dehydrogenase-like Zn-dependent dehydrogenase
MKAWVLHEFGDLRLEDVEDPDPQPRDGDVLLRTRSVQLSVVEAMLARGTPTYHWTHVRERLDRDGPSRLFGHEYCGEVVACGEGVDGFVPGQRVAGKAQSPCGDCELCAHGRADACQRGPIVGFGRPGALAELCVAPASGLVVIPDAISDEAAATVQPCSDAVAGVRAAGIVPGQTVAVLGFGATGLVCAEASRAQRAARVVVSDVRDEALALAGRLGYEVVDAREEDIAARVGQAADVAFDCASGPESEGLSGTATHLQATRCVRDEGIVVGISLLDGDETCLAYDVFRHRALRFRFPVLVDRSVLRETVDLMASGRLRVEESLSHVLDGLAALPQAIDITAEKGRHRATNPAVLRLPRSSGSTERH